MRAVRVYEPGERRYVPNNLYCHYCGNTHQWQIDLRLQCHIENGPEGLIFDLDSLPTRRLIHAIEKNIHQMVNRSYDRAKPIFHCANCQNEILDIHERSLEMCWSMDCPGCFDCGEWIDKETLIEFCSDCIRNRDGNITEDDCIGLCPHYDNGLLEVMVHYGLSLDGLKRELGY